MSELNYEISTEKAFYDLKSFLKRLSAVVDTTNKLKNTFERASDDESDGGKEITKREIIEVKYDFETLKVNLNSLGMYIDTIEEGIGSLVETI